MRFISRTLRKLRDSSADRAFTVRTTTAQYTTLHNTILGSSFWGKCR